MSKKPPLSKTVSLKFQKPNLSLRNILKSKPQFVSSRTGASGPIAELQENTKLANAVYELNPNLNQRTFPDALDTIYSLENMTKYQFNQIFEIYNNMQTSPGYRNAVFNAQYNIAPVIDNITEKNALSIFLGLFAYGNERSLIKPKNLETLDITNGILNDEWINSHVIPADGQTPLQTATDAFIQTLFDGQSFYIDGLSPDIQQAIRESDDDITIQDVLYRPSGFEIDPDLKQFVDNYEKNKADITSVAEIPLFIIVRVARSKHLMLYVVFNGKMLSFGFGYSSLDDHKKGRKADFCGLHTGHAGFYSPDGVVDPFNERYRNNIVAIGRLEMGPLLIIEKYFKDIRNVRSVIELTQDSFGREQISCPMNVFYGGTTTEYNSLSRTNGFSNNCASILGRAFNEYITTGVLVSSPSQTISLRPMNLQRIFTAIKNNDIQDLDAALSASRLSQLYTVAASGAQSIFRFGGKYNKLRTKRIRNKRRINKSKKTKKRFNEKAKEKLKSSKA